MVPIGSNFKPLRSGLLSRYRLIVEAGNGAWRPLFKPPRCGPKRGPHLGADRLSGGTASCFKSPAALSQQIRKVGMRSLSGACYEPWVAPARRPGCRPGPG